MIRSIGNFIAVVVRGLLNASRVVGNLLKAFVMENSHQLMFAGLVALVGGLLIWPTVRFGAASSLVQVGIYMLILALCVSICLYLLFSKRFREIVSDNAAAIAVVSIAVSVFALVFQQSTQLLSETLAANYAVVQANHKNSVLVQEVRKQIEEGSSDYLLYPFDTETYVRNQEHIASNYNFECQSAYMDAVFKLGQVNGISSQLLLLKTAMIPFSETSDAYVKALDQETAYISAQYQLLETSKKSIDHVVGKCQNLNRAATSTVSAK